MFFEIIAINILTQEKELKEEFIRGKALLLPDISLVGDIVNQSSIIHEKFRNNFMIREFELAVQGYIHPKIRVDAFASAHAEIGHQEVHNHEEEHNHSQSHSSDGHIHGGLNFEEGYITFLQIVGPLGGRLGRKYIEFGKFNPLHPEQWLYVDIPLVLQDNFGRENLIGDGGNISLLFPAETVVLKIEAGVWRNFSGPFDDVFYNGRIISALPVGELSEIEFGLSSASGIIQKKEKRTFSNILGTDLSFKYTDPGYKIQFIVEPIARIEKSFEYAGLYTSLFYSTWNLQIGLRFDQTRISEKIGINPTVAFLLTETTKLRVQYGLHIGEHKHNGEEHSSTDHFIFLQFIFAIGSHGHVLQF